VDVRSGRVLVIVASCVFAGLLWASKGLIDLVHRASGSRASVPARAQSDARPHGRARVPSILAHRPSSSRASVPAGAPTGARPRGQAGVALPSMSPVSLTQQPYSMSAPEFLSDPAAAQARSIAVGDVSGDGRDDLVFLSLRSAPNPVDNRMEVYAAYQRGDGHLDAAVKIAETGNNLAYQLLIADLDGNGVGDIITASVNGVVVLRSNADGTFTSSTALAGDPGDMIVTDVDRDGHLDVLVDSSDTSATVVYGDGQGGIDDTSTLPLPASAVRTSGDVTGDGLDDLILATIVNRPLQEFWIYRALPSGGYSAPVVLSQPKEANHTAALAVGDFNGDGRGDLVLDEARDSANLHLYFQDPEGNLTSSLDIARYNGSGSLIATDLDRDGLTDLALAHSGWGYIGYYLQTGTGFTPETLINANQYMGRKNYFAAGDLNHDGCVDLVVARWSQSPVLVYGQGCALRRIQASCRLPPEAVDDSRLEAAGLTSQLLRQHNVGGGANVSQGMTRGAGARSGLSGHRQRERTYQGRGL